MPSMIRTARDAAELPPYAFILKWRLSRKPEHSLKCPKAVASVGVAHASSTERKHRAGGAFT
jgi:hypothetical protein